VHFYDFVNAAQKETSCESERMLRSRAREGWKIAHKTSKR